MSGFDTPDYGKPKKSMIGDDEEEVTRKVAPGGGAGISFTPITPAQFTSPSLSNAAPGIDFASYQSTQTEKGRVGAITAPVQQHNPSVVPFRWRLAEVPTLPEFHPLERTAVFVENSSPSEVSSRISTVLRQRSIEASYDDEKAKVRCRTCAGVDFRVRLYRGRGNYNHGIIVEVQRRFGYSIDFHSDTKAILEAAEGLPTPPPPPNANNIPLVSDVDDDYDETSTSGASSLKMISKMLGHAGHDSHHLALQTLLSLTDAHKMGSSTARSVATELLKPENEVGTKLVDYIISQHDEDEVFNLQVMALTILANALSAVRGKIPSVSRELLRPFLLQELEQASSTNLLAAQQAARCLEFLWRGDHDVGQLRAALEKAAAVGQARHAGLEKQAQQSLDRIGQ